MQEDQNLKELFNDLMCLLFSKFIDGVESVGQAAAFVKILDNVEVLCRFEDLVYLADANKACLHQSYLIN